MNKTEEFYKEVLKRKVVNVKDLKKISRMIFEADDDYYYRKYLQKLLKEGKVGKIKFDQLPNFDLDFKLHGLYDLSMHVDETAHPEI